MGCSASAAGSVEAGGAGMVEALHDSKGKGYWDQVVWFGRKSSKRAEEFMHTCVELRSGDWRDPETGDKEWPEYMERMSALVSSAFSSEDPLVREAARTGWKVEVLHNNNGANQHDQGHADDGTQKWDDVGNTALSKGYRTDLNGWHTGYLVRRLRRKAPGKDEPKGKLDCWYEVAFLMTEYNGSPEQSLAPYPGPKEYPERIHADMHKNFFGGDAIRPYVPGRAEFEDVPMDCSWECNAGAAFFKEGQAQVSRYKAALTGDRAMAAQAAEHQARADQIRGNEG